MSALMRPKGSCWMLGSWPHSGAGHPSKVTCCQLFLGGLLRQDLTTPYIPLFGGSWNQCVSFYPRKHKFLYLAKAQILHIACILTRTSEHANQWGHMKLLKLKVLFSVL